MDRKLEKKSFVFKIIVSELVELICPYEEENTCHRQSMFSEKVLMVLHLTKRDFFQLNCVHSDQ